MNGIPRLGFGIIVKDREMYQWRKFQFFEEKAAGPTVAEEVKEKVVCSTSGRGQIVLAAEDAMLHVLDRGLKLNYSFQAHSERVAHIQQLKVRLHPSSVFCEFCLSEELGLFFSSWNFERVL